MTSRWLLPAAALGLAGCGGTAREPASSTAMQAATPARTASVPSGPAIATVAIRDFAYGPRTLHVARGARVRWVNRDQANHTVTFPRGPGDLGNLDPGRHLTVKFTRSGRYAYLCQYHPNMHGAVVVR
jgi:plastocyanin